LESTAGNWSHEGDRLEKVKWVHSLTD